MKPPNVSLYKLGEIPLWRVDIIMLYYTEIYLIANCYRYCCWELSLLNEEAGPPGFESQQCQVF